MTKREHVAGHIRVARGGRSSTVLISVVMSLLLVAAAYLAGSAETTAIRWVALTLALAGTILQGLQLRRRLHREEQRDELLLAILDAVPHILFYKDANSRYIGINQVFERTFGVRAEEVVGKGDAELFGQALHDRFVAQDRELLATGEARTFNEEVSIDGEARYIEARKTPFYDARGNAIGIVGLAMDVSEHRRLQEELQATNARLGMALRAARMGTWAWDVTSDAIEMDAFERELLGVPEGVGTASDVFARMRPEDVGPVRAAIERAQREDSVVDYEFRMPDGHDGWRWIEGFAAPYRLPGKPICVIGVNRDITERKSIEQKLQRTLLLNDQALELTRSGYWSILADGPTYASSPRAAAIFGEPPSPGWVYDLSEWLSRIEAVNPTIAAEVFGKYRRTWTGEAPVYDAIYPYLRPKDGRVVWLRALGVVADNSAHGLPEMYGVVQDITDFVEAKQDTERALAALERSRIDLDLALQSGQLGVWHSEARNFASASYLGQFEVEVDAHARRIWGRPADEQITRALFLETLHPEERERTMAGIAEAFARGTGSYADHYRIVRADGEVRIVSVLGTLATRSDAATGEEVRSITGVIRDVTDEENLKADLRQKVYEAQQAAEAKARFLAMMSHEIRTPMNGVIGMIELLGDTPMSLEQQQMLKTCKDSAFVLLTIINDILDFSKIEAGKLELDYTRLSPRRLAEGVGEALGTLASQRGIDLDVYVAPEVPRRVIGDRVRLRQILINLVSNAIKFTEKGGVTLNVSLDENAPSDNRARLRFDIVDTGIGMEEDTVLSLFQPFQQADAATTRRFGGTGLGLSIVKHLAELMGGRVECESRPLEGSRFSVVIPFETVAAGEHNWGYSIAGVRVLALVASESRRRIFAECLRQFDAVMECFDSADALLSRARSAVVQHNADLVLIDRDWSESQCAGLHRSFRENPDLSSFPFVIVRSNEPVQPHLVPDAVQINGTPLTRIGLVHGIAVALGRISPLAPAIATDRINALSSAPVREREEAAGRLILLAEDNPTNREVISRQLTRLGYYCDMAEDGEKAWAMLQSGAARYALLLTDCHMPRLDGYQLTDRIREHERDDGDRALPIIAITANALAGEGERCVAAGMNAYLSKPMQMRELKRLLAEFLPPPEEDTAGNPEPCPIAVRHPFAALQDVIGPDEDRLRRMLGIFEQSTREDCSQLERAHASGDCQRIRALAHKLKSGCRQLGEEAMASALEAIEFAGTDEADDAKFDRDLSAAQTLLNQLLTRIRAYLDKDPDVSG